MGTLVVIFGPTGVGKTDTALAVAQKFKVPILSCDSRQFYSEMAIGTAPPTPEQLRAVKHYFIADRSLTQPYTAGKYEQDVLRLLPELFQKHPLVLLVGGTGLYMDAVCSGIGAVPEADPAIRTSLMEQLNRDGVQKLFTQLQELDPSFSKEVDPNNPMRVLRALEVCLITGKPYSEQRTQSANPRPFEVLRVGLKRSREDLYRRINARVDAMVEAGLEEEARSLYAYRHLNTLNTVGYREWFPYFEGKEDKGTAIELIKRNSRRYAKRQMTWFSKYTDAVWFEPDQVSEINRYIETHLKPVFHADENLDCNPLL